MGCLAGPGSFSVNLLLMPPVRPRTGGSRVRWFALGTLLALVSGGGCLASLGHVLHHEDALEKADVIFVLGGTRLDRAAEGGHLFLEGWAPRILLSRQYVDRAEGELRARGLTIQPLIELQRDALLQMGVPKEAVELVDNEQTTTATEAYELRALWNTRRWPRIIVVTSKLHTGRVGLVMRRRFADTGARIIVRGTRYDYTNIDRWWVARDSLGDGLFEAQKLVAYWIGVAD